MVKVQRLFAKTNLKIQVCRAKEVLQQMDNHSYDDIINLPNPTSKNHPRMSLHDRAAQFAPFAALTGHDAAIKETASVITMWSIELSRIMNRYITSSPL